LDRDIHNIAHNESYIDEEEKNELGDIVGNLNEHSEKETIVLDREHSFISGSIFSSSFPGPANLDAGQPISSY